MEGFTDLHCHILPALDDGAKSMEETREMLKMAYGEGIRKIVATPHFFASRKSAGVEEIFHTLQEVQKRMKSWGIQIRLYAGNEIYYHRGVAELLEEGKAATLAGTRYVLVEFDPMTEYSYLRDGILKLDSYGYIPILAHTERYECLFEKKERLRRVKDHGGVIQVNASSFQGGLFDELGGRARYLMKKGLLDVLGTDAHSMGRRSPRIRESARYLYKKIGSTGADRILYGHPEAILEDKDIR